MTTADRIATALRPIAPDGALKQAEVPLIDQLAALWDARAVTPPMASIEPHWIEIARSLIGQREIPGSKNNPWIAGGWARLKASWFNDDETPWCGFFVAWCLDQAGLAYPKEFPRALSYADFGTASVPQLGAIGVKTRKGGGHVFFIVGETPDKAFFKALGGNQSDMVCIMDIRKADVDAIRWPVGVAMPAIRSLPVLPAGKISEKES
jgi:uncharacterized protein (TIGR02594 family)